MLLLSWITALCLTYVDLPAPVRPTIPTFSSPSMFTLMFFKTKSPLRYLKQASLKTTSPLLGQSLGGLFDSMISGASCSSVSYSLIRSTELSFASVSAEFKLRVLSKGVKPAVLERANASRMRLELYENHKARQTYQQSRQPKDQQRLL